MDGNSAGKQRVKRGVGFKRVFVDFANWCTIVCLKKIVTSAKWLAIIFSIVFVIMVAAFVGISVNLIIKHFKHQANTERKLVTQSQPFPIFTFCNENPLKRSVVDSDPAFAEIAKMIQQFDDYEMKKITMDDYGIGGTPMKMQRMNRAKIILRLMMNKLSDADRRRGGYNFTELVSQCIFAGKTCTSADFSSFLHPDYGVCYSFNTDREITRPGTQQNLRMLLTVNQDSPRFTIFDFLPTTESATIRAIIHRPDDFLDFTKNGFKLGASMHCLVGVSREDNNRMAAPYSNCTNADTSENFYGNYSYTLNSCQNSCLQRLAWEHCKCVDPLYPKAAENTHCATPADMACLIKLPTFVSEADAANGTTVCNCKPACADYSFHKTVTYGNFPSRRYKVATGSQRQREVLLDGQGGGRQGDRSDDDPDFDSSPTTTVTTTYGTIIPTSTTPPTTTTATPKTCAGKHLLSIDEMRQAGFPASAIHCRTQYHQFYNDPRFTVIQGWPCMSTKPCQTCVMLTDQHYNDTWPCDYYGYKECTQYNNRGVSKLACSDFFKNFDFVSTGQSLPNIIDWNKGAIPESSICNSMPKYNATCWNTGDCLRRRQPNDLSLLRYNSLISPSLWYQVEPDLTWVPCDIAEKAVEWARVWYKLADYPIRGTTTSTTAGRATEPSVYGGNGGSAASNPSPPGTSGRKKRSALAPPTNDTQEAMVDRPGYGSCEYANTNFQSAAACIRWYKRNGLLFEMYYESLDVNVYTQGASYPLVALLTDIAGHAGLWLGMSVISVVEILGLICMCASTLFRGKKMVSGVEDNTVQSTHNN